MLGNGIECISTSNEFLFVHLHTFSLLGSDQGLKCSRNLGILAELYATYLDGF